MKDSSRYTIDDLRLLMQRLRAEDGCPWDRKQTFDSIVPYTIEEVYEVAEAIAGRDMRHIREELGDLLFQVIFYAQLAEEQDEFGFPDVVDQIVRKLLRRHPHVFPEGTLESRRVSGDEPSQEEIRQNWERIKREEKVERGDHSLRDKSVLSGVSDAVPALEVADKLQRKAAEVGFDWPEITPVFEKVEEELEELKHVVFESGDREDIIHELGDVLFCCVNLARHLEITPELALRRANGRFRERFQYIEQSLGAQGRSTESASLAEMDGLWNEAKRFGKNQARPTDVQQQESE